MADNAGKIPILTQPAEGIAQITLRRPGVANRLQPDDLQALQKHLQGCEAVKELRVLILAAQGKYFSAGYDLGSLDARDKPARRHGERTPFEYFVDAWEQTPLITIAALQGPVYGGATDLALASDFRIGTPSVTATMPAAQLGLHLYPGLLQRYVSRLGVNFAKALMLTAARFSHIQLLAMGFLTEVVPDNSLNDRVMEMAVQIARLAPLSLRGMKGALNAAAGAGLDEDQVRRTMVETYLSRDCEEGIKAWQEKRPPRFTGS